MRLLICLVLVGLFLVCPLQARGSKLVFDVPTGEVRERPPTFRATDNLIVEFRNVPAAGDSYRYEWRILVTVQNDSKYKLDEPIRFLREPVIRENNDGILRFSLSRFVEDDLVTLSLVKYDRETTRERIRKARDAGEATDTNIRLVDYAVYWTKLRYSFQVGRPSIYEIRPGLMWTWSDKEIYEVIQLRILLSPQVTSQEFDWWRWKHFLHRFTPSVGTSLGKPRVYFAGINFQLVSQAHAMAGWVLTENSSQENREIRGFAGLTASFDILTNLMEGFSNVASLKQKVQTERGEQVQPGDTEE